MKTCRPAKTLGDFQTPCILSLMALIETQSKPTLVRWATAYATERLLPVYERIVPADSRPRNALLGAIGWLEGRVRFADAKVTNNDAHTAATQAEGKPAAQAAARAAAHAALTIHVPAHCLGVAFYGLAALAYAQAGEAADAETCARIVTRGCAGMEAALRKTATADEPNPARLDWKLWARVIGKPPDGSLEKLTAVPGAHVGLSRPDLRV